MSYKDDFERIKRIEFLRFTIPKMQQELSNLENYFTNKKKVKEIVGYEEKNGCKPLLGLHNKIVYHPSAYCELKQCYLLYDDMREKSCYYKACKYLLILEEHEKKKGIKGLPMKYYDVNCGS